jgi:predicted enzyme related to lactoylglutathione lyase
VRENPRRVERSEITKNQQRQSPKTDIGVAASPEPKTTTDHATTGQQTQNPIFGILLWSLRTDRHVHPDDNEEVPQMNLNQVTLPVHDMDEAAAFYRRMGFLQIVDTPHYARFECTEGLSTFSLGLNADARVNPATIYFENEDLDELVVSLKERGIEFQQDPTDMSYLWREAVLSDPSGNKIKLYWAGESRRNPPWRVERRD